MGKIGVCGDTAKDERGLWDTSVINDAVQHYDWVIFMLWVFMLHSLMCTRSELTLKATPLGLTITSIQSSVVRLTLDSLLSQGPSHESYSASAISPLYSSWLSSWRHGRYPAPAELMGYSVSLLVCNVYSPSGAIGCDKMTATTVAICAQDSSSGRSLVSWPRVCQLRCHGCEAEEPTKQLVSFELSGLKKSWSQFRII